MEELTKYEVINIIANNHLVEDLIISTAKHFEDSLLDLAQDIYIDLINKDETLIVNLYKTNQLQYFIKKMISNNIFSKNSPYHYKYRNRNKLLNIDDYEDKL